MLQGLSQLTGLGFGVPELLGKSLLGVRHARVLLAGLLLPREVFGAVGGALLGLCLQAGTPLLLSARLRALDGLAHSLFAIR